MNVASGPLFATPRQVRMKPKNEIAIYGNYIFHDKHSSYKCQLKPRIYKFIPGESYSIDIAVENKICILSVIQKKSDGTIDVVVPTKVLPRCRIADDRKDVLQTNADAKRTSLSWPSLEFCS